MANNKNVVDFEVCRKCENLSTIWRSDDAKTKEFSVKYCKAYPLRKDTKTVDANSCFPFLKRCPLKSRPNIFSLSSKYLRSIRK